MGVKHLHPLQGGFNKKQHRALIIRKETRQTDVGLHLFHKYIPLKHLCAQEKITDGVPTRQCANKNSQYNNQSQVC